METDPQQIGRGVAWTSVALFLAGIFTPIGTWVVTGERDQSALSEFRDPAPPPELGLTAQVLEELPANTAAWFADAFPHRHSLVRLHNAALWFGLEVSVGDEMVRGVDEWLFLDGEPSLSVHRGELLTPAELEVWIDEHLDWHDWLAARDIQLSFCIAAEKQSIYDQFVPPWMGPTAEHTRTDQFLEALEEIGVVTIDTRQALRDQAREELIYYPLGTHWNDAGAYVAYRLILEALADPRFGPPLPLEAFERVDRSQTEKGWYGDSWLTRMHIADLVPQPDNNLIPKQPLYRPFAIWPAAAGGSDGVVVGPSPLLPKLVMLRDSFGKWVWPLLAPHCSQLVGESFRRFDPDLVDFVLPDHVLHVRVERLLGNLPPMLPLKSEELEQARVWNSGSPLALEDGVLTGTGEARIWLRGTRPQPVIEAGSIRADWPQLAWAKERFRLVGGDGVELDVDLRFPKKRRTAFSGPFEVRLPVTIEPLSPKAEQVQLAGRRVADGAR